MYEICLAEVEQFVFLTVLQQHHVSLPLGLISAYKGPAVFT
jgi:hypothetical protein